MNDGLSIEEVHCGHDAILEFLFGCDADVAQHGAGELGKETLDEVEPRAENNMTGWGPELVKHRPDITMDTVDACFCLDGCVHTTVRQRPVLSRCCHA